MELTLWLGSGAVSVPEEIADLSELRVLDLSGNRFSEPDGSDLAVFDSFVPSAEQG